jgi:uncharacterized membrane protein YkoI
MGYKLATAIAAAMLVMSHAGSGVSAAQNNNESHEGNVSTALASAKTTLSQAIVTAEQRTGGKAYEAGVDVEAGKPRIIVETTGPNGVQTVTVDAQNGQVIGTHAGGERD